MNGSTHYTEAEQYIVAASQAVKDGDVRLDDARLFLQFAQVHATLALAAGTVDVGVGGPPMTAKKSEDWREVTR